MLRRYSGARALRRAVPVLALLLLWSSTAWGQGAATGITRVISSWRSGAEALHAASGGKGLASLKKLEGDALADMLGRDVLSNPDVIALLDGWETTPDAVRAVIGKDGDAGAAIVTGGQLSKLRGILDHVADQRPALHAAGVLPHGTSAASRLSATAAGEMPVTLVGGPVSELIMAARNTWTETGGSKAPEARMTEAMHAVVLPRIQANNALADELYQVIRENPVDVIGGKGIREALARGLGKAALEQGISCGGSIADPSALLQRQLASASLLAGVRPAPPAPPQLVAARLEGVSGEVKVAVDPTLERVFDTFTRWERALAEHGVEAEFFIGAGEVRRALYGLPSEGPGDFEVYFHVNNQQLPGKLILALKQIRERWGVDIKADLHEILGAGKELDLMYKDSRALASGGPWTNKLGKFEEANEAADTSVNGLLYAPSRELLIDPLHPADSPNLIALTQGQILYTEPAASAQLDNPVAVTGTWAWSYYSGRIVRQALRSIRADIDLALSPNPNGLALDEGFHLPVSGFDLFFSGVPPAELSGHPMDEIYMELFLKIFRNRTNDELAQIKGLLTEHYPRTFETWKELGLNVDLLLEARTATTDMRTLEQRALHHQNRYAALAPLITGEDVLRNPFADAGAMDDILGTLGTPKGSPGVTSVPAEILQRVDPRLAHRTRTFESLSLGEKLSTVNDYLSLAHTLAHPAPGRLGLVGVREKMFPRLPFLRTGALDGKDGRTLGQFIEAEIEAVGSKPPTTPVSAEDFNVAAIADVERRITVAQGADKTPVIFVDLDDTLFHQPARVVRILKRFDEINDTAYFAELEPSQLVAGDYPTSIYGLLEGKVAQADLAGVAESAAAFLEEEQFAREFLAGDVGTKNLVAMLDRWKDAGARIVYITARRGWSRRGTEDGLKNVDAPEGELIMRQWDEKSSAWLPKSTQINAYLEKHGDVQGVAVLDNDRSVLSDVTKNTDVAALRTVVRGADGEPSAYLLAEDGQIYEVLATQK